MLAQEFQDAVTGVELQWTELQIARTPKIVDLGTDEKTALLELQQHRQTLIETLQGD
jgi:hypothetical protein